MTLEDDVNGRHFLPMVADIANRSKHLVLIRSRVDATVSVKRISVSDGGAAGLPTASYTITLGDGSAYDAHYIAQGALTEWQSLLARYGL
jgi:hypothetical protein